MAKVFSLDVKTGKITERIDSDNVPNYKTAKGVNLDKLRTALPQVSEDV